MTLLFIATLVAHILAILSINHYKASQLLFIAASALQTILCGQILLTEAGWVFNAQNACLVVSWLSNIIVLLANFKFKLLRTSLSVIAIIIIAWIYFLPYSSEAKAYEWALDLHILFSILSYCLLFVSSLISIVLALQIHKMKRNVFIAHDLNINSLLDNEEKLFKLIVFGWLFLSCALLTGIMFVDGFLAEGIGHKVVFSLLAWIVFAVLIFGRVTKGWRGKTAIKLNLFAMTLLMLGFIGSQFVLDYLI